MALVLPRAVRSMDSPVIQLRFKGRLVQTLSFQGDVLRIGYSHLISDGGKPQIDSPDQPNYLGIHANKPILRDQRLDKAPTRVQVQVMWG